MPFSDAQVAANRDYFARKLQAEKQRNDVLHAVESGAFDFVLLDTRDRNAFMSGHIPGAWSAPFAELGEVSKQLPKDREIVTYCWGHD
jgi:rhodanese-related sulfurtransferase